MKNYGRRYLKWDDKGQTIYTLSGQWVGHMYGSQFGTERQRRNAAPTKTATLQAISKKILWGYNGSAGQIVQPERVKDIFFIQLTEIDRQDKELSARIKAAHATV